MRKPRRPYRQPPPLATKHRRDQKRSDAALDSFARDAKIMTAIAAQLRPLSVEKRERVIRGVAALLRIEL